LEVIRGKPGVVEEPTPRPPGWAAALPSSRSGYVETAHPELILPLARRHSVSVLLRHRVGEHVVAGTTLAWIWRASSEIPPPGPDAFRKVIEDAVGIGFERTLQQDAAFGIRQLVDIACKALSPAVNDPYTAVQAIDHLAVLFCALATRPLGDDVVRDPAGQAMVIVPGRRFGDYLVVMCGLIRRYGAKEPTVMLALLRLLESCAAVQHDPKRSTAIDEQAALILADCEQQIAQPADALPIRAATEKLRTGLLSH
jgi:uncharacterized membrane protein